MPVRSSLGGLGRVIHDWNAVVVDFVKAVSEASAPDALSDEEIASLVERHEESELHDSGGGLKLGLIPIGSEALAVVGPDAVYLWDTGGGEALCRFYKTFGENDGAVVAKNPAAVLTMSLVRRAVTE